MTDAFSSVVTIKKLFTESGKMYGFAATEAGEIVYIPGRLVPLLKVGDIIEAKLKPSSSTNAKFFMSEIPSVPNVRKRRTSLIVYDRDLNIVPRTAPGVTHGSNNL